METNEVVGTTPACSSEESDVRVERHEIPADSVEESKKQEKRVCSHCGCVISEDEKVYKTNDGDIICSECLKKDYFVCEDCGYAYLKEKRHILNQNFGAEIQICEDCFDDHWRACDECGKYFNNNNEGQYVGSVSDYVCDDCINEYFVRCVNCDELVRIDETHSSEDGMICESCFDDNYTTCDSCREVFRNSHITYINGECYCNDCAENISEDDEEYNSGVMGYHAGRDRDMYYTIQSKNDKPKEKMFFGVELECEEGKFDIDYFSHWTSNGDIIHFEHDGSLNNGGVELITQPCSLLYHQNDIGWNNICSNLIRQGFVSHNSDNCGLHVHISRRAIRPSTIVKMDVFINRAKSFWSQVARREIFYGSGGWYNTHKRADIAKGKFKEGACQGERYTAVNTNNDETVEIRIFKGTLKSETIIGTIEILHGLVAFLDNVPFSRIYKTESNTVKFIDYLAENHNKYSHVFPMLRRLIKNGDGLKKQIGKYYGQFCESVDHGENH